MVDIKPQVAHSPLLRDESQIQLSVLKAFAFSQHVLRLMAAALIP